MAADINNSVRYELIGEGSEGQKIDNFLIKTLKNVPKSHIYKLLRSGQVRVNKKRIKTDFRLSLGDSVRIPPFISPKSEVKTPISIKPEQALLIEKSIIHEDDALIVINKPCGLAVHGGSGISYGLIELLRKSRPDARFLELVHRIDKETSGIILIAKKRPALVDIHKQMRDKSIHKKYQVIVNGKWRKKQLIVDLNLIKTSDEEGQKKVRVVSQEDVVGGSKASRSVFFLKQAFEQFSCIEVKLVTGRTHQIRVHLSHLGFSIVGDDKYGDFSLNKRHAKLGFKRMFLHACELGFRHPLSGEDIFLTAPIPSDFIKLKHYAKTN